MYIRTSAWLQSRSSEKWGSLNCCPRCKTLWRRAREESATMSVFIQSIQSRSGLQMQDRLKMLLLPLVVGWKKDVGQGPNATRNPSVFSYAVLFFSLTPSRLAPSLRVSCHSDCHLCAMRDLSDLSLCHWACQCSCRPLTLSVSERACRVATRRTKSNGLSARPCLSVPFLPQLLRVWSGRDFWRCCESHAAALIDVWEMPCSYFSPPPPTPCPPFLVLTPVGLFTGTFFHSYKFIPPRQREKGSTCIYICVTVYNS